MEETKRETFGKIYTDLQKNTDPTLMRVVDLADEMHPPSGKLQELIKKIEEGKLTFPNKNFFIAEETISYQLFARAFRSEYYVLNACPTPKYDQTVYQYLWRDEQIRYIWTIPSKDTCYYLRANADVVVPEERQLLSFVLGYFDGTLLAICNQLNGEKFDSIILE
jgi:hypothetical protein